MNNIVIKIVHNIEINIYCSVGKSTPPYVVFFAK